MAQSANIFFGGGAAFDSSSNQQINTFGTGNYTTPSMSAAYLDLGSSIFLGEHFGFGADISWQAARSSYTGLDVRPSFYNLDGIWEPSHTKKFEPEIHFGLGGMKLSYTYTSTNCNQLSGCQTSSQAVANSSHFQVHFGAAARYYVTDHVFIRPAFDGHYVNNLFQYGSNFVPEVSLGVGYSFGRP